MGPLLRGYGTHVHVCMYISAMPIHQARKKLRRSRDELQVSCIIRANTRPTSLIKVTVVPIEILAA